MKNGLFSRLNGMILVIDGLPLKSLSFGCFEGS